MPQQGASNEYPQHMFYGELVKIIPELSPNTLLNNSSYQEIWIYHNLLPRALVIALSGCMSIAQEIWEWYPHILFPLQRYVVCTHENQHVSWFLAHMYESWSYISHHGIGLKFLVKIFKRLYGKCPKISNTFCTPPHNSGGVLWFHVVLRMSVHIFVSGG